MRRRLLTAYLVLDGLCILVAPSLLPALSAPGPAEDPASKAAYVEIAGLCVEEMETEGADAAGRPVDMALCAGS